MTQQPPHNLQAEESLIGAALLSHDAIRVAEQTVTADDFYKPSHQHIWNAIVRVAERGQADPVTVAAQLAADGHTGPPYGPTDLHGFTVDTPAISAAGSYAEIVASTSLRRRLIFQLAHASEIAYRDASTDNALTAVQAALTDATRRATGDLTPDPTYIEHMERHTFEHDWLIPEFLERGDRMLITAAEGAGKSILCGQIAFMAAAGIHPWTGHPVEPVNAAIIDLENSPKLMSRRLAMLRSAAASAGAIIPGERLRIRNLPEGIDLTKRRDQIWLRNRCEANQTQLLVIGPVYRMLAGNASKGDTGGEDQARQVTRALDDIRNQLGITLVMETHSPHGNQFGRDLRPFGSSVWLRWPEFGIGLRKESENCYEIDHWRGARDQRDWPTLLQRHAGRWPWTAIMPRK